MSSQPVIALDSAVAAGPVGVVASSATAAPRLSITVDTHRCVGSTLCTLIAPHTFALNADGQSTVIDPAGDCLAAVLDAAEQCPMMAIKVEDAATGESYFNPG